MPKAFIHPASQARLEALVHNFPQSLLITGEVGVGFSGIIEYIAEKLHTSLHIVLPEKDEKVDIEKGTISVDSIRRLYDMTKTIETGRRVIVIDYAERMGTQAQNAFLKLLEEPGANTYFILLSHVPSKLLSTITSRAQRFDIQPITRQQSESLLDELQIKESNMKQQLLFMAEGRPAELTRLTADDQYFESRAQIVRDARQFLQGSAYDRLVIAQNYKDTRENSLLLLQDALKLVEINVGQGKSELISSITSLITTYERIEANGNIRLQLAAVMV